MKSLLAITIITAACVSVVGSADARGTRGGGAVAINNVQVGPRVTAPVIRPERVGPQQLPPRQINGPRESGRGINCSLTGPQQLTIINRRTGRSETITVYSGTRCPQRI